MMRSVNSHNKVQGLTRERRLHYQPLSSPAQQRRMERQHQKEMAALEAQRKAASLEKDVASDIEK